MKRKKAERQTGVEAGRKRNKQTGRQRSRRLTDEEAGRGEGSKAERQKYGEK
jgi:hypothetical protein